MLRLVLVLVALAAGASAFAPVSASGCARVVRPSAVSMKFSPIKTGVTVQVISGDDKGKTGKVLAVDRKDKVKKTGTKYGPFVVVEGINIITKHVKPVARGETGKRIQKEGPIHISNVKALEGAAAPPPAAE
jgi:ribosomal protein L24